MRLPASALLLLLVTTIITAAPAAASCSNASLNGGYGYFHGRPTGYNAFRLLGQMQADGNGNVTGSWTLGLNGAISYGTFTGIYSISKDCIGTLVLRNEDQLDAHFSLVLDDNNQGFQMIQTDNGYDQPGYGMAQGSSACGLSGKKQTLATNLLGVLYPSEDVEAVVGQLTLDGKGTLSGNQTSAIFGVIAMSPVTGSYTEDANCTGTLKITPEGSAETNFNAVFVNDGKEILLIETDVNTFVGGTAQE